ncbi:MAG: hypothetical protein WC686_02345 [Candidatus Shapirobacteria bacterium]
MSLTYTAYQARIFIKLSGFFLAIIVLGYMGSVAAIKAWEAAHPKLIKPTVRYGLLPKIVFPEKQYEKKTFALELPNDAVPDLGDQMKVYLVFRPDKDVMAFEHDKQTAKNLGFAGEPVKIADGIYEFGNNNLNYQLIMNVVEGSFKLQYPYKNDQTLMAMKKIPNKEQAISMARGYLSTAGKWSKDLEDGEQKVSFWKIEIDGLKAVSSQSEGNVARVEFFRKNLEDKFKIMSTNIAEAPISVMVTGMGDSQRNIVEFNFKYADIDREAFSTYPIKSTAAAIEDLKGGNYWPAVDTSSKTATIRKVYLAYLEPFTLTSFMQPIYVFEGDGNFVAYVPAVDRNWVKE